MSGAGLPQEVQKREWNKVPFEKRAREEGYVSISFSTALILNSC